jgi:cytochrome c peroxidase
VPIDNPMSDAKVELGRFLFHDNRLSGNGTQSCSSCHQQQHAFTDGRATALGSTGEVHFRNSMSLTNVAYNVSYTWADPSVRRLETQALVPLQNVAPVEMGITGREPEVLARLETDEMYVRRFREAFPDEADPITLENVGKAIASFERTMLSFDSPYDRFLFYGEADSMSPGAMRGMNLFFSEELRCAECHGGMNFAGRSRTEHQAPEPSFHNTATYDIDGKGSYPEADRGLVRATGEPDDEGRFRAPTLRNIAMTAPYMHDGSIATLSDVIDHYAAGGRANGNPNKSEALTGFQITDEQKNDLVAFMESLTDEQFLTNPAFADPWQIAAR